MQKSMRNIYLSPIFLITLIPSQLNAQSERDRDAEALKKAPSELLPGAEKELPPTAGMLLRQKELELEAREAEVEQATKDLELAEKQLNKKIARLETLISERQRIAEGILNKKEQEKLEKLNKMVEVTAKMPPENAALYLLELSIETSAKIVSSLKSRKAAAILSAMPPSSAAEISRKYLESGKSNPKSGSPARNTKQPNPK